MKNNSHKHRKVFLMRKVVKENFGGLVFWLSWLILHLQVPGSHKTSGLCPGCSSSHPAPSLWPGKAHENGTKFWDLHSCGRPRRSSWILISDQLSTSHCSHMGSEPVNGGYFSLYFLLIVKLPFQ